MAVPPDAASKADASMLDILEPTSVNAALTTITDDPQSSSLFSTNNNAHSHSANHPMTSVLTQSSGSNGHGPIVISMSSPTTSSYYAVARPTRESVLQRLSEALLRRSLTKIDLSQRGLRPSDARLVKMALCQNANLSVLKLGYNNLGDVGVSTLSAGIAIHRSLASLDLGFNNIGDEGCKALATAMMEQQQSSQNWHQTVVSSSSSLVDMATEATNPTLDTGAASHTTTSGPTATIRRPNRENGDNSPFNNKSCGGTLRTLYLAGNLIGEDGALAMADCLRRGSSLRKLYMTGNRLGAFGVKALTEAIMEDEIRRGGKLVVADERIVGEYDGASGGSLASNDVIGMEDNNPANEESTGTVNGIVTTTRAKRNQHASYFGLQEIFLGGTGMGTGGCQAVAGLLAKSTCLRVLSLPNCGMGDTEVGLMARSIKANRNKLPIESIQLSFNNMTHKGLESLMNAVWGSATLKELRLDNNEIGDRGAHQVAAILPYVKTLEVLDVGFNSIKTAGLNTLMKAVAETNHLQSLSVSGNALDVAAAKAVAYALAYNRSLESLFLVHCSVGLEGQRHISAGVVSNSHIALRKLTGFDMGPVIVTLGFPAAIEHWTNEQVLNFIHMMWEKSKAEVEQSAEERELDPLSFLPDSDNGGDPALSTSNHSSSTGHDGPLEASVVVEVAKKAYESLVANGVDVFSRRQGQFNEPSFGSPLAGDAIMVESPVDNVSSKSVSNQETSASAENGTGGSLLQPQAQRPANQARSFVAEPESSSKTQKDMADPARKKRIVEWLCSNIRHLNELSQLPFDSSELWKLHQHYFTPVVNESGGEVVVNEGSRIVSSVPEVSRGTAAGSIEVTSTQSTEPRRSVPASDPALPSPNTASLPMLKRKVSYRFLGDAMMGHHGRFQQPMDKSEHNLEKGASVARMIEEGHTGHSMPPKTKRARRNRTRISFVPRIKAKLDSSLDVCHEKALITMRQLYFVEQAILGGLVNPLEPSSSRRTHLSGVLAAEAEMIIVDMI